MTLKQLPLVITSLALATGAFAQSETEETKPTAQAPVVQAPAASDPLAEGEDSFPVAPEGGVYIREQHGEWEVRCVKEAVEHCNLTQLLRGSEGNSVAEFNMEILPNGEQAAAGVTLVSPLGTLLTAQATMRIDGGKAKRYPFAWCENAGCVARFGLTKADVDAMKKGAKGSIVIVSVVDPQKPLDLALSLDGFTAAYNSVAGQ
ncbi:invasion-associated locus B family protein [Amylibacter marinus]|uniref:Invasion-associated locus B family protein n=1 Tax=Amylibacter marinus TaxID=1475483 RepID=A0ABQ5VT24_9RHOB|nr:invasion associated locus B family protein [Amylibacter marinus]GLQ34436.1 invasion-associated locus B family protein [Amylibacter marinus]